MYQFTSLFNQVINYSLSSRAMVLKKLRSSGRAAGTYRHWAISQPPLTLSKFKMVSSLPWSQEPSIYDKLGELLPLNGS